MAGKHIMNVSFLVWNMLSQINNNVSLASSVDHNCRGRLVLKMHVTQAGDEATII